jgi:hypothetical protein
MYAEIQTAGPFGGGAFGPIESRKGKTARQGPDKDQTAAASGNGGRITISPAGDDP